MTKAEAIKELKMMLTDNSNTGAMYNALKLAIEALRETDMGLNNGDHLHPFGEPFGWTEEEIQKHGLRELLKEVDNRNDELSCSEKPNRSDVISRQDAIDTVYTLYDDDCFHESERDIGWNNAINNSVRKLKCLPPAKYEYGLIDNGITWYSETENKWNTSREVTAWMPLPEPYKAESEEQNKMAYISFEEVKEILKNSIDETTKINEALEKTVQFIYLKGYEDGSRRLWISATISPKVSGKYLVVHGGNYIISLDNYTTMEDAVRIFDEGYEDYIGWQSQNVIAWMPLPESYKGEHDG